METTDEFGNQYCEECLKAGYHSMNLEHTVHYTA
jgi:hypothetical protein